MLEILRSTPLWVYAVFLILTYYGVRACFESHESKRSLQITPAIFVTLSLASLNLSQGPVIPLLVYVPGVLAGWFFALRFYSYTNVKLVGGNLVLGGTVKVLMVYWGFFAWRYYLGYQAAIYPQAADEWPMTAWSALGAGLINGLIVGRSLRLLRFFKVESARSRQLASRD
ncbi:MAG: hypothetical protein ACRESJ_20235 [Pseudomonas sp.]|uniref:hypothetical protein n=1 Tax=Pseudomonas sp. TaxID=306 RepID=UPI003D6ECE16